jgi:hypothetical protein
MIKPVGAVICQGVCYPKLLTRFSLKLKLIVPLLNHLGLILLPPGLSNETRSLYEALNEFVKKDNGREIK